MWTAYLNILWILFTIAGLGIFGWMPATVAVFSVWRKLLAHDGKVAIFQTFLKEFKGNFFRNTLIGFILMMAGGVLVVDFLFYQTAEGILSLLTVVFIVFFGFFYLLLFIYLPPVIAHFDLKFTQYFKQAMLIGVSSPLASLSIGMVTAAILVLYYLVPVFIVIFGVSLIGLVTMKICLMRFSQLELSKKI